MTQPSSSIARHILLTAIAGAFAVGAGCSSCSSCSKSDAAADAGPKKALADHGPPAMPPPGSDADQKRVEALALATSIDSQLATFKHDEKPAAPSATGQQRKAEVWYVDGAQKKPKKLVLHDLDASGASTSETDMYFDDKQQLAYAKAPDGHFVFHDEGLALWLDPEQRLKRGVKPMDANNRAVALKKDMTTALGTFAIR